MFCVRNVGRELQRLAANTCEQCADTDDRAHTSHICRNRFAQRHLRQYFNESMGRLTVTLLTRSRAAYRLLTEISRVVVQQIDRREIDFNIHDLHQICSPTSVENFLANPANISAIYDELQREAVSDVGFFHDWSQGIPQEWRTEPDWDDND